MYIAAIGIIIAIGLIFYLEDQILKLQKRVANLEDSIDELEADKNPNSNFLNEE